MTTKVITIGQLQKGDIILSTTSDPVSKIVKFATSSKYSHARLYIGEEHIIEAIDPIVKRSKLIDVLKGDLYAAVYRMPNNLRGISNAWHFWFYFKFSVYGTML